VPFLTPQQPTRAASVTPFSSERPGWWIFTTSQMNRVCARYRASRFHVAQHSIHPQIDWVERGVPPPKRPFQPHQPVLPGMQLRRFADAWRASAWGLPLCVFCKLAILPDAPWRKAHGAGSPTQVRSLPRPQASFLCTGIALFGRIYRRISRNINTSNFRKPNHITTTRAAARCKSSQVVEKFHTAACQSK